MYDNIGGKIKGLAKALFVIEAIAAVIGGGALGGDGIGYGLLVIFLGPIFAWISTWFVYGFGQLIENSDIMAKEHFRKNEKHEKDVAKSIAKKEVKLHEKAQVIVADSNVAYDEYINIICPNCKEELSFAKERLQDGDVACPMCGSYISL